YTVWNPENKKLYTQVPVKVRSQSHLETIVELVRSELPSDESSFIEKRMLETQMYQENFEVYIQTLISHALDPNFLTEIFQEQAAPAQARLLLFGQPYNPGTLEPVQPDARLAYEKARLLLFGQPYNPGTLEPVQPDARLAYEKARLLLFGQPYNPGTLEPVQPDARLAYEKATNLSSVTNKEPDSQSFNVSLSEFQEFLVCASCCARVQMYSRISHQKYLMYAECSKRVAEKRMQDPRKDTTLILNELLADELWLSQVTHPQTV
ncbi:Glutamine and serine-rich protein 1, partial [Operophtera brumata]